MSHTPGPWKAGVMGGQCHIEAHCAVRNHPGLHPQIAGQVPCVYDPIFSAMDGERFVGIVAEDGTVIVGTEYDELKISHDDARLIAAAPDLLEALKAMYDEDIYADGEGLVSLRHTEVGEMAKTAINKAEVKA